MGQGRVCLQPDRWSAGWAGDWLRVKAAVCRLLVFVGAGRAHGKVRHRRVDTIVRNLLHDRKAWSTMCAVRERITIAPFVRVQHFRAAGGANCSIGSNARAVLATYTFGNAEVFKV